MGHTPSNVYFQYRNWRLFGTRGALLDPKVKKFLKLILCRVMGISYGYRLFTLLYDSNYLLDLQCNVN